MNNPPAFPQHGWTSNPEILARMQDQQGLTMRDFFAASVIGPLMGSDGFEAEILKKGFPLNDLPKFAAEQAYEIADAMMEARKKGQP
jgi:hypothetical protein